jgi:hypothetical protein
MLSTLAATAADGVTALGVSGTVSALTLSMVAAFLCGLRPFGVMLCLSAAAAWGGWPLPAWLAAAVRDDTNVWLLALALMALGERWSDTRSLAGHAEDLLLSAVRVPFGALLVAGVAVHSLGTWGWLCLPLGAALAASGFAFRVAVRALGTLLGWRRTVQGVALAIDIAVPALLLLAAWHAGVGLAALVLLLVVALPLTVWWVRELRSRWRRWALLLGER